MEIGSLAIPSGQAVHRVGMTDVVEPGAVSPPPVRDATSPEQLAEGVVDRLTVVRSPMGAREEGDIGWTGAQGVRIAPEVLAERRRHGDEAIRRAEVAGQPGGGRLPAQADAEPAAAADPGRMLRFCDYSLSRGRGC